MRIMVKPGVVFKEINARLFHVCVTAQWVWEKYGLTPTITEAWRKGTGLHPKNMAWDLRIWGLKNPKKVSDELREMLNIKTNDYDVVYGDKTHLDHIHVEYDPKPK